MKVENNNNNKNNIFSIILHVEFENHIMYVDVFTLWRREIIFNRPFDSRKIFQNRSDKYKVKEARMKILRKY